MSVCVCVQYDQLSLFLKRKTSRLLFIRLQLTGYEFFKRKTQPYAVY